MKPERTNAAAPPPFAAMPIMTATATGSLPMNIPASRINLEHLKTFHCAAESGSFTGAARLRFLTQPAVSQHIQGLENALHVVLFDRSHKKITLTGEGKILYAYTPPPVRPVR